MWVSCLSHLLLTLGHLSGHLTKKGQDRAEVLDKITLPRQIVPYSRGWDAGRYSIILPNSLRSDSFKIGPKC
jgi:hypothetical protein